MIVYFRRLNMIRISTAELNSKFSAGFFIAHKIHLFSLFLNFLRTINADRTYTNGADRTTHVSCTHIFYAISKKTRITLKLLIRLYFYVPS